MLTNINTNLILLLFNATSSINTTLIIIKVLIKAPSILRPDTERTHDLATQVSLWCCKKWAAIRGAHNGTCAWGQGNPQTQSSDK